MLINFENKLYILDNFKKDYLPWSRFVSVDSCELTPAQPFG